MNFHYFGFGFILTLFICCVISSAATNDLNLNSTNKLPNDSFHEKLTLYESVYPDHKQVLVFASFQFKSTHYYEYLDHRNQLSSSPPPSSSPVDVYTKFPRAIGQLVKSLNVKKVSLSLSKGRWNYLDWGLPTCVNQSFISSLSASEGAADLQASFFTPSHTTDDAVNAHYMDNKIQQSEESNFKDWLQLDIRSRWKKLTHALAGQFCSSLNNIDQTKTFDTAFNSTLDHQTYSLPFQTIRGILSNEAVCTENITPWIKLLPCRSQAGISYYLTPSQLFNSYYNYMSVDVQTTCLNSSCNRRRLDLIQRLVVVFDPEKNQLFTKTLYQNENPTIPTCSATDSSVIEYSSSESTNATHSLFNKEHFHSHIYQTAVYDPKSWAPAQLPISANRYLTGTIQGNGLLKVDIINHSNTSINIVYQDIVPWYLQLFFHDFQIKSTKTSTPVIYQQEFLPSQLRGRPSNLKLSLQLEPSSITSISLPFERAFLHFTEYPPDANRGFDVGPAMITLLETHSSEKTQKLSQLKTIYTESLLVILPTPDFSMPYNVICLTCTVLALAFGSLYNLTTRKFAYQSLKK